MRAPQCHSQRALDHGAGEGAAIGGAARECHPCGSHGSDCCRIGLGNRRPRRSDCPSSSASTAASRSGVSPTPIDADMDIAGFAALVLVIEHGRRGKGEIAAPAGKFLKSPSPPRWPERKPHLHDDLVGRERSRKRAAKELSRLDHARAGFSDARKSPPRRSPQCPASRLPGRHGRGCRRPCRDCGFDNARPRRPRP